MWPHNDQDTGYRILKLTPIHASAIYQIPWNCLFYWISFPFRKNHDLLGFTKYIIKRPLLIRSYRLCIGTPPAQFLDPLPLQGSGFVTVFNLVLTLTNHFRKLRVTKKQKPEQYLTNMMRYIYIWRVFHCGWSQKLELWLNKIFYMRLQEVTFLTTHNELRDHEQQKTYIHTSNVYYRNTIYPAIDVKSNNSVYQSALFKVDLYVIRTRYWFIVV